jgi:hypothetical protein
MLGEIQQSYLRFGLKAQLLLYLPHLMSENFYFYLQITFVCSFDSNIGARVSVVVKALCYKPEGRGFDTR